MSWGYSEEEKDRPAQFTSEDGEGRDLYACHNRDAVFARLLWMQISAMVSFDHVMVFLPDLENGLSIFAEFGEIGKGSENLPSFFDLRRGLLRVLGSVCRLPPSLRRRRNSRHLRGP